MTEKPNEMFHCGNMQSSEFILLNRNWIASLKPDMNNNLVLYDARHAIQLWIAEMPYKVFLVFKFEFDPVHIHMYMYMFLYCIYWAISVLHVSQCICVCIYMKKCSFILHAIGCTYQSLWLALLLVANFDTYYISFIIDKALWHESGNNLIRWAKV